MFVIIVLVIEQCRSNVVSHQSRMRVTVIVRKHPADQVHFRRPQRKKSKWKSLKSRKSPKSLPSSEMKTFPFFLQSINSVRFYRTWKRRNNDSTSSKLCYIQRSQAAILLSSPILSWSLQARLNVRYRLLLYSTRWRMLLSIKTGWSDYSCNNVYRLSTILTS